MVAVLSLKVFEALATELMVAAEPYLIKHLPVMLAGASAKTAPMRDAATAAVSAVCLKSNPNCLPELLPMLFKAAEQGAGWQTRALALKMVASFGDHAPEQLGFSLPEVNIENYAFITA